MKILVLEHNIFARDCVNAWLTLGHQAEYCLREDFSKKLREKTPDLCLTINPNYSVIAQCLLHKCPYASWIVDPLSDIFDPRVFAPSFFHPLIFYFSFDAECIAAYKARGFSQIYFLPLASAKEHYLFEEPSHYFHDVSFVGNIPLREYYDFLEAAKKNGDLNVCALMTQGKSLYNDPKALVDLAKKLNATLPPDITINRLMSLLGRHQSVKERLNCVDALAHAGLLVSVYGDNEWQEQKIAPVDYRGYADHEKDLGSIFSHSKINLNITRAHTQTTPMRVFDVTQAGGFLLTNARKELSSFFEIGKEIVVFDNTVELVEKAHHYLENDEERRKIALAGHKRTDLHHQIAQRMQALHDIVVVELSQKVACP